MGVLDTLDQADVFQNCPWFQPGGYIVQIAQCKYISGHNGESFVIEATVLASNSTHPDAPPVGMRAAQVWSVSGDKIKIGQGTWKGFLCACYGIEKDSRDGAAWKALSLEVLDDGALNGSIHFLECHMKKTQKNTDFTMHNWRGTPTAEKLAQFGLNADGTVPA